MGLDWRDHVRFDEVPAAAEVDDLMGDTSKAARVLGWPARVHTPELAGLMIDAELQALLGKGEVTAPVVPLPLTHSLGADPFGWLEAIPCRRWSP